MEDEGSKKKRFKGISKKEKEEQAQETELGPNYYNKKKFYERVPHLLENAVEFDNDTNCEVSVIVHRKKDGQYFSFNTRGNYSPMFKAMGEMGTANLKKKLTNWNKEPPKRLQGKPLSKWAGRRSEKSADAMPMQMMDESMPSTSGATQRTDTGQQKTPERISADVDIGNSVELSPSIYLNQVQSTDATGTVVSGTAISVPSVPGVRVLINSPRDQQYSPHVTTYTLLQPATAASFHE